MGNKYTKKLFHRCLLDIDVCILSTNAEPQKLCQKTLIQACSLMKPGSYFALIAENKISYHWAFFLEEQELQIKEQIAIIGTKPMSIILAMKKCENNYALNALVHNVAGLHIDNARIGNDVVGWNGLGKVGKTWNNKNCGFRKQQKARPAIGRFPQNMLFETKFFNKLIDSKQFSKKTNKFFSIMDTSETDLVDFCVSLLSPGKDSLIVSPFSNRVFEAVCNKRQQHFLVVE